MPIRNPLEWLFTQGNAAAEIGSAHPAEYWPAVPGSRPVVRRIAVADLRAALTAGMQDFAATRTDVVFLCLIYPVIGILIALVDARESLLPLLFPTAAGFALLGPLFAVGLYEMSRRRALTGQVSWFDVFQVLRSPSIGAIAGMGLILIALFLLWLVAAEGIYDATLGPQPPASDGLCHRSVHHAGRLGDGPGRLGRGLRLRRGGAGDQRGIFSVAAGPSSGFADGDPDFGAGPAPQPGAAGAVGAVCGGDVVPGFTAVFHWPDRGVADPGAFHLAPVPGADPAVSSRN